LKEGVDEDEDFLKILRRVLKAEELGVKSGDLTTLED